MGQPVAECHSPAAHGPEATGTALKSSSAVTATDLVSLLLPSVFCPDPLRASHVPQGKSQSPSRGQQGPLRASGVQHAVPPTPRLPAGAVAFSQKSTHLVASFGSYSAVT